MASKRSMGVAVATVVLASLASGCGSDSSVSGSGSGGSIKIMAIGQFQAPSYSLPEMEDGAKAAVKAINKAGGINGHEVDLLTCNDQGDPNVAAKCARQAVGEHVVAVTGSISEYSQSMLPTLEAAKIAYIGALPLTNGDFTSPVSFPLDGGNPGNYAGEGMALVKKGCKKVGIVNNADSSAGSVSAGLLANGVKAAGGSVAKTVAVRLNEPDMSPAVSTLIGAGSDCIGLALPAAQSAKFLGAIRQSSKPHMLVANNVAVAPLSLVQSGKGLWNGVLLTTSAYAPGSEQTSQFAAELKAQSPSAAPDTPAQLAWTAVKAFEVIAKSVSGPVTSSSVLAQAKKASDLHVPTFPQAIDFTKPNPVSEYARLFNTKALVYEVKNDNYALTSPTPLDVQAALK